MRPGDTGHTDSRFNLGPRSGVPVAVVTHVTGPVGAVGLEPASGLGVVGSTGRRAGPVVFGRFGTG